MEAKILQNLTVLSGKFDGEKAYWLRKLAGPLSLSAFPHDYAQSLPHQHKRGSRGLATVNLPPGVCEKMIHTAGSSDFGIYLILLTGLNIVLSRYSGRDDMIIGSPVFKQEENRFYNNRLVALRTRLDPARTFRDLLFSVKQTVSEANDNMNYPFSEILKLLAHDSGEEPGPIFANMVVFKNLQDREIIDPAEYETVFLFERRGRVIEGEINYDAALFSPTAMRLVAAHLAHCLMSALDNPAQRLAQIDLRTAPEKELIDRINRTPKEYQGETTIPQLFSRQASRAPRAIAVIEGEKEITYEKLEKASNRMAHLLVGCGVGANSLVAVYLDRGIHMVGTILGIHKAGGAYVPVDPGYPPKRIQYIIEDSACKVLVSESSKLAALLAYVPQGLDAVICLDRCDAHYPRLTLYRYRDIQEQRDGYPPTSHSQEDLAYIIYTSGSTGNPKGVMICHRAVLNTLFWLDDIFGLTGQDVVAQKTSASFTDSVWEFFWPLLKGSRLVVIGDDDVRDPQQLYKRLEDHKVTVTQFVPALMKVFLENIENNGIGQPLPRLRWVFNGGEALPVHLVRTWYGLFQQAKIANIYGMTESAIYASCYIIDTMPAASQLRIPLGRPIANTTMVVLGPDGEVSPLNIRGEICIGGIGMTRGYLNQASLSEGVFCRHPQSGERLYRTGDVGFLDGDGHFQYEARQDNQIQVRGYRVEPGEIESLLLRHDDIRDAVVFARSDHDGFSSLYAYVICEDGRELDRPGIKDYLSDSLPDYMIPTYFVQVAGWPLSPNGKIDRQALPAPEIPAAAGFTAPRDEIEKKLREIWAEVLMLDEETIGTQANFFEWGGHSLRAITLAARVHKEMNVKIPLIAVFDSPTLIDQAEYIRTAIRCRRQSKYAAIEPVESKEYYPLSSAQHRLYFLQQMDPTSTIYNIPRIVNLDMPPVKGQIEETFKKLIRRHEGLRTSFVMVNGRPVQRIHPEPDFKMNDHEAAEEEIPAVIRQFERPFDLTKAPLLRVGAVSSPGRDILMIDMHHIVTDGNSYQVLYREFLSLSADEELPEIRLQYRDYSEWQNSQTQKDLIKQQETYWLTEFADEVPRLDLPLDFQRPAAQSTAGNTINFYLDKDETQALTRLARVTESTLYMVIFSIYNIFLAKLSSQADIVVGTVAAGRRHSDLDHIIGMFVNTLAIRNHARPGMTYMDFLREVRGKVLNAFENQDYQFEKLVKKISGKRDIYRNPIFDVMFSYFSFADLNPGSRTADDDDHADNTDLSRETMMNVDRNITRFDLMLFAFELQDRILFALEYATDLFKEATIIEMKGVLLSIIGQIIENVEVKLQDIKMLPDVVLARPIEDDYHSFDFAVSGQGSE
jgi:amino acid adenylation domain-containing protein